MRNISKLVVSLLCIVLPGVAFANMIILPLFVQYKTLTSFAIIPCVLIEWISIKYIFNLSFTKSAVVSVVINTISTAFGAVFFYLWPLPFLTVMFLERTTRFLKFAFDFSVIALLTTMIEIISAKIIFKLPLKVKSFLLFLLANFATIAIGITMAFYE